VCGARGLFTAPQGHGERNIRGGFPRGCGCPFLQLPAYFCLAGAWLGTLHSFQHVWLPRAWLGKTIVFLAHRETDKETLTRKRCWVFALVTVSVRAGQLRANDMIVFIYLTDVYDGDGGLAVRTLRFPLMGQNRPIFIGNLRLFWVNFTD
jgi:hypothetical protein